MNDLESVERAIAALEAQRDVLGSAVVDTALAPLREQRAALLTRSTAEQRKLVTVLFADVVDFTVLTGSLDPEDTRAIINAYFRRWHEQIDAHGGVVEKFIGDAVMAVFGLHQSHEDDPHRAIRSALATFPDKRHILTTRVEHPAINALVRAYRVRHVISGDAARSLDEALATVIREVGAEFGIGQ